MYKQTRTTIHAVIDRMNNLKNDNLLNEYELFLLNSLVDCMEKEETKIAEHNKRTRKFIAEKRKIDKNYCR